MFLKIAAQAFEAGDFVNIFKGFWVFEAYFLIKNFSYEKKCVYFCDLIANFIFSENVFQTSH